MPHAGEDPAGARTANAAKAVDAAAARRLSEIHRPYAPLTRRRRLLVVLLAVATAVTVVSLIVDPPGGVHRVRAPGAADVPRCAEGQASGCVGSRMDVLVPAAALPASAAPPASAGR